MKTIDEYVEALLYEDSCSVMAEKVQAIRDEAFVAAIRAIKKLEVFDVMFNGESLICFEDAIEAIEKVWKS